MKFCVSVIEPAGYAYMHFLYDLCKYLCFSIESAGYDCCILRNKLAGDRTNILVGAHMSADPALPDRVKRTGPYIVLNTEIITGNTINNWGVQKTFSDVYLPLMRRAAVVWTGVAKNIDALKKLDVEADQIFWGYHPRMEEIHHKKSKDIDFLFCGSVTPHRKKMLDALAAQGCKVVTMFDDAAMYRNDLIARARVNLAPNQGPGMNHLGGGRVLYLVNNRSIVVVERCVDQARYEACFPWAETDRWVDLCLETLRRPDLPQITDAYYERFKKIPMADFLEPLIAKFADRSKKDFSKPSSPPADAPPVRTPENEKPSGPDVRDSFVSGLTSIILLTRNRLDQTKKCVKNLRKHTPEAHEILFVDNASADGAVPWVQSQAREHRHYRLIAEAQGETPAAAYNCGIRQARGEYILLLSSEASVGENWLSSLQTCLTRAPAAGIVGPMTDKARGPQQALDRSPDDPEAFAARFRKQFASRRLSCRQMAGFCLLFRRDLADQIGGLDEQFAAESLWAEDFCLRAELAGFKNYLAGDVFLSRQRRNPDTWTGNPLRKNGAWASAPPPAENLRPQGLEMADSLYAKAIWIRLWKRWSTASSFHPPIRRSTMPSRVFFWNPKNLPKPRDVIAAMPRAAQETLRAWNAPVMPGKAWAWTRRLPPRRKKMLSLDKDYTPAVNLLGLLAFKKRRNPKSAKIFRAGRFADPVMEKPAPTWGFWPGNPRGRTKRSLICKEDFSFPVFFPMPPPFIIPPSHLQARLPKRKRTLPAPAGLILKTKTLAFLYIDILIRQEKFADALLKIEDALDAFGMDDPTLQAALTVREKVGPLAIGKPGRKGTLSLCMIVKNEEKYLVQCLKSVRDVVDEMIIVDTGSTDRTKDIARVFGATLYDFPWTGDFPPPQRIAGSRHGRVDSDLDADEVISPLDYPELQQTAGAQILVSRRLLHRHPQLHQKRRRSGMDAKCRRIPGRGRRRVVKSAKVRLLTRNKKIFFSNPVHETLEGSLQKAGIPIYASKIVVHHYGKLDVRKDLKKGEDYYLLGKIKYENDPANMKYVLELAKQAQILNKLDEAVDMWQKLIALIQSADKQSANYKNIVHMCQADPLSESYLQLASAYLTQNRFAPALEAARKAMEGHIRSKEYIYVCAQCELVAGAPERMLPELENLLQSVPDYPPALLMTAVIHALAGQKEKTSEIYRRLLQKHIQITPLVNKFARLLQDNGRTGQAGILLRSLAENRIGNRETAALLEEFKKRAVV
jgi:glycosyltransferase involved in cell wall biosynthesis